MAHAQDQTPLRVLVTTGGRLAEEIVGRLASRGIAAERLPESARVAGLDAAPLARASVLILAADDDAGNVDLALTAHRLRPGLRLVVRLFDPTLVHYLHQTLQGVTILSVSAVAAPVFADAVLRAIAQRRPPVPAPPERARRRPRFHFDRVLLRALVGLLALVVPYTLFFAHQLNLRLIDAFYFVWATVTTIGYGDITLRDASDGTKVAGMFLMFAGAAFMAVLLAMITDRVVARRLEESLGRVRVRGRDHILVIGAGNVGLRVSELLGGAGRRVVVVERSGESRNVEALRAAGTHVIAADARSEEVLALAGIDRAAAVVALTDSDSVNLHVALLVRARGVPAPVVLRVTSPELSAHVSERGESVAVSSMAAAADAFARAAEQPSAV